MLTALALLGAMAIPAAAAPLRADPTPTALDRSAYVQLLHHALDDVTAGEAATGAARDQATARALADLPARVVITDPGGTLAEVDLGALRAALQQQPSDLIAAHQRLAALLDLLDPGSLPSVTPTRIPTPAPGESPTAAVPATPAYLPADRGAGGPPLDSPEAGRRLDQVLADPRFHPQEGNGIQAGLAGLFSPVVGFLLGLPDVQRNLLIGAVAGLLVAFLIYSGYRDAPWSRRRYWATVVGGGLGTVAVVFFLLTYFGALLVAFGSVLVPVGAALGVLVAVGVLVFAVAGLRRARSPGSARLAGAFAAEAGWTATQARNAAATAASAADYRKAIRYRYLATLLALDESGRLRFDPALTNQEYLRRAPGALHEPLRPLVQIFDRLWYGGYPAGAQDYADYQALANAAEQAPPEVRA